MSEVYTPPHRRGVVVETKRGGRDVHVFEKKKEISNVQKYMESKERADFAERTLVFAGNMPFGGFSYGKVVPDWLKPNVVKKPTITTKDLLSSLAPKIVLDNSEEMKVIDECYSYLATLLESYFKGLGTYDHTMKLLNLAGKRDFEEWIRSKPFMTKYCYLLLYGLEPTKDYILCWRLLEDIRVAIENYMLDNDCSKGSIKDMLWYFRSMISVFMVRNNFHRISLGHAYKKRIVWLNEFFGIYDFETNHIGAGHFLRDTANHTSYLFNQTNFSQEKYDAMKHKDDFFICPQNLLEDDFSKTFLDAAYISGYNYYVNFGSHIKTADKSFIKEIADAYDGIVKEEAKVYEKVSEEEFKVSHVEACSEVNISEVIEEPKAEWSWNDEKSVDGTQNMDNEYNVRVSSFESVSKEEFVEVQHKTREGAAWYCTDGVVGDINITDYRKNIEKFLVWSEKNITTKLEAQIGDELPLVKHKDDARGEYYEMVYAMRLEDVRRIADSEYCQSWIGKFDYGSMTISGFLYWKSSRYRLADRSIIVISTVDFDSLSPVKIGSIDFYWKRVRRRFGLTSI